MEFWIFIKMVGNLGSGEEKGIPFLLDSGVGATSDAKNSKR